MKFYKLIKAHPILDVEPMQSINVDVEMENEEDEDDSDPISTLLQLALMGEYQQWDLYTAYASRLKGLTRGPIADEFKAHAGEELGHIELLQRYLVSMGVNPTLERKPVPEMPDGSMIKDIVALQLKFEQDAVALYKKILNAAPENEPLKLDIESVIVKEQEHVHDLELLLKNAVTAKTLIGASAKKAVKDLLDSYYEDREVNLVKKNSKVTAYFKAMEPGEPTKPQAGYGQGCGCNCPTCTCDKSFLIKVDHKWCAQALKELTPDIYARWYQGKLLSTQDKAFVAQAIALKWGLKDKRAMMRFLDSRKA